MKKVKLVFVVAVLAGGWAAEGSWQGAAAWAMILAFLWFVWAFMHYDPNAQRPVREPQPVDDFNPDGKPAIRGKRNPDPTRPTTDDYAGMLTNYIERKRG
jgi:hypothetical protein